MFLSNYLLFQDVTNFDGLCIFGFRAHVFIFICDEFERLQIEIILNEVNLLVDINITR